MLKLTTVTLSSTFVFFFFFQMTRIGSHGIGSTTIADAMSCVKKKGMSWDIALNEQSAGSAIKVHC